MKQLALAMAAMALMTMGCAQDGGAKNAESQELGLVRHVVLFKFKETAQPEQVKAVEAAFAALPGKISQIRDFEWGTDISVENLADGYTHCFFVTFDSEKDRDAYLPHPEHQAFVKLLGPILDKALVVDYKAAR